LAVIARRHHIVGRADLILIKAPAPDACTRCSMSEDITSDAVLAKRRNDDAVRAIRLLALKAAVFMVLPAIIAVVVVAISLR
jgi:hypothetical protein